MEFDLLNEILTDTVAGLFPDLKHNANFIRSSSQMGQDKSEIPRDIPTFLSASSRDPTLSGTAHSGDYSGEDGVKSWLSVEAKQKL